MAKRMKRKAAPKAGGKLVERVSIKKNDREVLVSKVSEYKGVTFVQIQSMYFSKETGDYDIYGKSVTCPLAEFDEFMDGLAQLRPAVQAQLAKKS